MHPLAFVDHFQTTVQAFLVHAQPCHHMQTHVHTNMHNNTQNKLTSCVRMHTHTHNSSPSPLEIGIACNLEENQENKDLWNMYSLAVKVLQIKTPQDRNHQTHPTNNTSRIEMANSKMKQYINMTTPYKKKFSRSGVNDPGNFASRNPSLCPILVADLLQFILKRIHMLVRIFFLITT